MASADDEVHEEQVNDETMKDETTTEEAAEESQKMHKGCVVGHLGEQCRMAAVD